MANNNQPVICDSCGRPPVPAAAPPVVAVGCEEAEADRKEQEQPDATISESPKKAPAALKREPEPATTVFFKFNSSVLSPEERKQIRQAVVRHSGAFVVQVAGHTCRIGTHSYNRKLSTKRGKAVASYLRQLGVRVVTIEGFGDRHPLGGPLEKDRRAVITISEKREP